MEIKEFKKKNFEWVDVINPTGPELDALIQRFGLHSQAVQDCMEPEHLPKYESIQDVHFLMLRAYDPAADAQSDTIQALTRKVAIFFSKNFILTFHRTEQPYVQSVFDRWNKYEESDSLSTTQIVSELIFRVARSYEPMVSNAFQRFEEFEADMFKAKQKLGLHKNYFLKRRLTLMKRLLWLMHEPILELSSEFSENIALSFKTSVEYIEKLTFRIDEVNDNLTNLLSLQIAIASQKTNEASHRTNEVIRTLTIFSILFMPLNFIAGIYGMNFEHMPELKSRFGYPLVLLGMAGVAAFLYFWFKRKGWLKS